MSEIKKFEKMLVEGKLSRREFLVKASALGLMAAVSPSLLSSSAFASTPKRGGRLRVGSSGAQTAFLLDPVSVNDMMPAILAYQLRNNLVEVNYENEAVPELAENWESTPDAKTWIFKLRKGVEFHNGKTLTAEDIIYSINHHRGEDSKSPSKGIVDPIVDIKADGKYTVVFSLESGNADFPYYMSEYHLNIFPDGTTDFSKGIGTGPYIVVSHEPGVRMLAKRNPNYFKEGMPYFDEVEIIGITVL